MPADEETLPEGPLRADSARDPRGVRGAAPRGVGGFHPGNLEVMTLRPVIGGAPRGVMGFLLRAVKMPRRGRDPKLETLACDRLNLCA